MGLIQESRNTVHPAGWIIDAAPRPSPAPRPPSPAPELERDWRTEELRSLRAEICRQAPPRDDEYWKSNPVWVGCTDAVMDKIAGTGDFVKLTFKVETQHDSNDLWDYYESNKAEILSAIKSNVPAGNIRIVNMKIERGSVTIFVMVQITIGLALLVIAILANYDNIEKNFKRAMPLIKQYANDAIGSLKRLFGRFGFGAT